MLASGCTDRTAGRRLVRACAGAALSGALALAAAAPADAARAGWFNCSASGGDAFGVPIVTANPAYQPCAPEQNSSPVDLAVPLAPIGVTVLSGDLYARTVLKSPDRAPKEGDHAQAYAAAAVNEVITPEGSLLVENIESSATVTCRSNGRPHLFTRGGVTDIHVNGEQITDLLNDPQTLDVGIGTLEINQTVETADSIEFTALKLTPAVGPPVVLGHTRAGFTGNPCRTGSPPLLP